ncbi:MAG TPA: hypothetical protein VFC39_22170 [Acidobacteriaceae bacterium]|nr:hypothetical protein [Acidobacteriaceae bacterium]
MKLRHIFGLILCALLCLFAIGAKTAVYRQHQEQVANLTATKVWQNTEVPSPLSTPVQAPVLLAMALLLMVTSTVTREARLEQPSLAARNWFFPALAVRPPPVI